MEAHFWLHLQLLCLLASLSCVPASADRRFGEWPVCGWFLATPIPGAEQRAWLFSNVKCQFCASGAAVTASPEPEENKRAPPTKLFP